MARLGSSPESLCGCRPGADRLFRAAAGEPGICAGALQAARGMAARGQACCRRRGKRPVGVSARARMLSHAPQRASAHMGGGHLAHAAREPRCGARIDSLLCTLLRRLGTRRVGRARRREREPRVLCPAFHVDRGRGGTGGLPAAQSRDLSAGDSWRGGSGAGHHRRVRRGRLAPSISLFTSCSAASG